MADSIFIGRRKTAVARVILRNGNGQITVNGKELEKFFVLDTHQENIRLPFRFTETLGKYNVIANVQGGGINGQSDAVRLGIARALVSINPDFRQSLKSEGMLKRDPRMVERKKYGRPKARKRFQFSKR